MPWRDLLARQKQIFHLAINGAPINEILGEIARAATSQIKESRGAIFIMDADGAHLRFGAADGMSAEYTRAVDGFEVGPQSPSCGSAAYTGTAVIVGDVATDPLWAPFLELAIQHGIRCCWSFPIKAPHGQVLGTIALYHPHPRQPTSLDLQSLELLAQIAAIFIDRHKLSEEQRSLQESAIHNKLMAKEVDHRVMNSLQMIGGILSFQSRTVGLRSAAEELSIAAKRVVAVAHVHRHIHMGRDLTETDCAAYLDRICADLSDMLQSPIAQKISVEAVPVKLPTEFIFPIGMIVNELVTNAAKHGARQIRVALERSGADALALTVSDDGVGLPPTFSLDSGKGLGMKVIKALSQELKGSLKFGAAAENQGAQFTVTFPI
jgi:two-component sensor histidine kinase